MAPNVPNVPSEETPLGQRYLLHEPDAGLFVCGTHANSCGP